jgi:hypothetical protein
VDEGKEESKTSNALQLPYGESCHTKNVNHSQSFHHRDPNSRPSELQALSPQGPLKKKHLPMHPRCKTLALVLKIVSPLIAGMRYSASHMPSPTQPLIIPIHLRSVASVLKLALEPTCSALMIRDPATFDAEG